jgi:hypothetical protein
VFSHPEIEKNPLVIGERISCGEETLSEIEYKAVAALGSSCFGATDVMEKNRSTLNIPHFLSNSS